MKGDKPKIPLWIRVLLPVLAVAVVGVIITAVVLHRYLSLIQYKPQTSTRSPQEASSIRDDEAHPDDGSAESVRPGTPNGDVLVGLEDDQHLINILLIGQDRRAGQGTQRSDSMILLSFNRSSKAVAIISFLRDAYVNIPGYGDDKLCHAYAYGGMDLLNQTIASHYGVRIDGNVEVDFGGFSAIVDLLGGVEVTLSKQEADYLNDKFGWTFQSGKHRLNGEQALQYSRIRAIDSDYARTARQRKVLESLLQTYKQQSPAIIFDLLERILPLLTTNIPTDRIMSYAMELLPMVRNAEIDSLRIPVDGTFEEGYIKISENQKMWCQYHIDFQQNQKILGEYMKKVS